MLLHISNLIGHATFNFKNLILSAHLDTLRESGRVNASIKFYGISIG